ncbi:MAG: hypothetical protein JXL81_06245 [Deltaproteobacteria bacterium]|nr:hypothetical protein [Deltaproteobacteria bacterium]
MNLWTFICIIIIIGVIADLLKKIIQGSQNRIKSGPERQKIDELIQRINNLESRKDLKAIEKRLQALESIVVDSDYVLDMKFKKAFGKDLGRNNQQF